MADGRWQSAVGGRRSAVGSGSRQKQPAVAAASDRFAGSRGDGLAGRLRQSAPASARSRTTSRRTRPSLAFTAYCLLLLPPVFLAGCRVNYSFTGGDVGQAKTFTVETFQARAPLATAQGAQTFTETLRDLLQAQTPLDQVRTGADVTYDGEITGYDVQPVSIQASETAALNRLTITVSVRYTNTTDKSKNSEFSVSRFSDYNSTQDLSTVEAGLVAEISKLIAQDIFDRTLGNW